MKEATWLPSPPPPKKIKIRRMDMVPHIENRKFFPYPYEMFQRLKVTDKATPKKIPFKDPPKEIFIHKGGGYQMEWPTTFFN